MEATGHRHLKAGAAVAAAGAVGVVGIAAVSPIGAVGPWPRAESESVIEQALRLAAAGDSLLNIPFNLFQDLVNIPYNEVAATNVLANSFFWTGNWWTPSATNIWGEDPGDPGHFMAILDYLFPFAPQVSGVDQPEIEPTMLAAGTAGLGQQLAMLAAAELPVSVSCDAIQCSPMAPVDPITGFTNLDRGINFWEKFTNFPNADNQLPMFSHWLQVPLQQMLTGYQFPDTPTSDPPNPTSAGIADPDAGVGPNGEVPGANEGGTPGAPGVPNLVPSSGEAQPGFGFPGTIDGPDGENLMPWAGVDFKFDPFGPFQQWLTSLQAAPDLNDFHLVGPDAVAQAMKALLAGLVVDFNPFVSGSPACPGLCDASSPFAPPNGMTTLDLVKMIQSVGPANPLIAQWIDQTEATQDTLNTVGMANGATNEQVLAAIEGLQTGTFTFDQATEDKIFESLNSVDPHENLAKLVVNSGLVTDPGMLSPWPQNADGIFTPPGFNPDLPLDEQHIGDYGGFNQLLVWPDLLNLIDPSGDLLKSLTDSWDSITAPFTDPGDILAAV